MIFSSKFSNLISYYLVAFFLNLISKLRATQSCCCCYLILTLLSNQLYVTDLLFSQAIISFETVKEIKWRRIAVRLIGSHCLTWCFYCLILKSIVYVINSVLLAGIN